MATVANFAIDQGSTFRTQVNVGEGFDLTGYTARGRIRKSYNSSQFTDFGLEIVVSNSITESDFIIMSLSSSTTSSLKSGRYVYDIELLQGNVITRILEGQMEVLPSVINTMVTGDGIDFAYNSENFTPHMMYHPSTGEEFYASTYSQHITYNNLGYVHVYPLGGGISSLSDTPTTSALGGQLVRGSSVEISTETDTATTTTTSGSEETTSSSATTSTTESSGGGY